MNGPIFEAHHAAGEDDGVQGYLAHKKLPPPYDPTVGLYLGPCGGPGGGGAVSHKRGTRVDISLDKISALQRDVQSERHSGIEWHV